MTAQGSHLLDPQPGAAVWQYQNQFLALLVCPLDHHRSSDGDGLQRMPRARYLLILMLGAQKPAICLMAGVGVGEVQW